MLEANLDPLRDFLDDLRHSKSMRALKSLDRVVQARGKAVVALTQEVKAHIDEIKAGAHHVDSLIELSKALDKNAKDFAKLSEKADEKKKLVSDTLSFSFAWATVMLVTFLDAYLEDGARHCICKIRHPRQSSVPAASSRRQPDPHSSNI